MVINMCKDFSGREVVVNNRHKNTMETWWNRIPLALEGEEGEERITGFFRLLLDLQASTGLGEVAALLWDWAFACELDGSDFLLFL